MSLDPRLCVRGCVSLQPQKAAKSPKDPRGCVSHQPQEAAKLPKKINFSALRVILLIRDSHKKHNYLNYDSCD